MYRIALLALVGVAGFAQTDAPAVEKPPAEVDQALRARVIEFYNLLKNHEYRKAENWIAEDTKDYYYAGVKPEIRSFELLGIEYSDRFTHAKATTRCSEPIVMAGFPPTEITLNIPTLWKLENENWYVYEDPTKISNPSGLQTKIQTAVEGAASSVGAAGAVAPAAMPKEIPKDPAFAMGKIRVDKPEIKLAPGTAEPIAITNGSDGPVTLEMGYPLKGIEAKLDRNELAKGETAILTLAAGPEPVGGTYYLRVMPTAEALHIQVQVK